MDNRELMHVYGAIEDAEREGNSSKALSFAKRKMGEYVSRILEPKLASAETHRIGKIDGPDTMHLYLTPVFDRLHALEPTTPVSYGFLVDGDDLKVCLDIRGRTFSAAKNVDEIRLLRRTEQFLEVYIEERKGPGGCSECGARFNQMCLENCSVLEAVIVLNTIRGIT